MSRIRSVHPGFFRDDRLVPCSAFARLLFIGLGVEADDKGIFEWKPVTIKMSVFPGDNIDIAALLAELVEADAIRQFDVAGKRYGAIRNFRKYQKPKTPNDVHPMAEGIAEYVSLPPKGETVAVEGEAFPQNGENGFQMEEGGGKGEEDKGQEKSPPSPPPGEGAVLFDRLVETYPTSRHTKREKAERLFLKLSPADQETAVSQARLFEIEQRTKAGKSGRPSYEHAEYVPALDTWLKDGRWKPASTEPTPIVPMTRLDRELDADLWKACEAVTGKPAPTSDTTWTFLDSVIAKAREGMAA